MIPKDLKAVSRVYSLRATSRESQQEESKPKEESKHEVDLRPDGSRTGAAQTAHPQDSLQDSLGWQRAGQGRAVRGNGLCSLSVFQGTVGLAGGRGMRGHSKT